MYLAEDTEDEDDEPAGSSGFSSELEVFLSHLLFTDLLLLLAICGNGALSILCNRTEIGRVEEGSGTVAFPFLHPDLQDAPRGNQIEGRRQLFLRWPAVPHGRD